MDEGIETALTLLSSLPADTMREIAMVTDGMPNSAIATLCASARAASQGVSLCVVGIGSEDVDKDFLGQLTPNVLIIEGAEGLRQALATLLTQSSPPGAQAGMTAWGQP